MRIGYSCLTVGVLNTELKTCRIKNASEKRLKELIEHNLKALDQMIEYNIANQIDLFRICSDVIPYASSSINSLNWWELFETTFNVLGNKIKNNRIRVSMHPGSNTVLNAKDKKVVENALKDLAYHARFLDLLGLNKEHKIILPVGGIFRNKKASVKRFIGVCRNLDENIRSRLVIENDEKCYGIDEVLEIAKQLEIPVVFNVLNHHVNPTRQEKSDLEWISCCKKTWKKEDGIQKIHYAQQNPDKKPGVPSQTIMLKNFTEFFDGLEGYSCDIMLESKDKNLSVVKCKNALDSSQNIQLLEKEWSKYKYAVLEGDPVSYLEIRKLLHDKETYPVIEFYERIEEAVLAEPTTGNAINVAQHIWGYFRNLATPQEKKYFFNLIERYENNKIPIKTVKNDLWKLVMKYEQTYLMDSYYFIQY